MRWRLSVLQGSARVRQEMDYLSLQPLWRLPLTRLFGHVLDSANPHQPFSYSHPPLHPLHMARTAYGCRGGYMRWIKNALFAWLSHPPVIRLYFVDQMDDRNICRHHAVGVGWQKGYCKESITLGQRQLYLCAGCKCCFHLKKINSVFCISLFVVAMLVFFFFWTAWFACQNATNVATRDGWPWKGQRHVINSGQFWTTKYFG